jgi:hypothetical protein
MLTNQVVEDRVSVLGLARVIAQVSTNASQFGGWGPRIRCSAD